MSATDEELTLLKTKHIQSQFIIFALVGVLGFVVDTLVLYFALYLLGFGFYLGRLISYLAAATSTWALNRRFTFADTGNQRMSQQWAKFLTYNAIGGLVNYGVYSLLVANVEIAAEHPVIGVAAGSITGLVFNFTASRRFVFNSNESLKTNG